ncbi:MAG TPA: type II secretion system major pseudopilin GspG, partial [Myxococcales bacterium]|nr:type II secretion system major pseudopilin GspG [Myxococcales bacterium]
RRRRGMTLIEIMVVMVILGLIAGMVGIAVVGAADRARVDRTKTDIHNLQGALDLYKARHGRYPDTGTGLKALVDESILNRMPKDAWDSDYQYLNESGKAVVKSFGADGQPGGDGTNADLSNQDTGT